MILIIFLCNCTNDLLFNDKSNFTFRWVYCLIFGVSLKIFLYSPLMLKTQLRWNSIPGKTHWFRKFLWFIVVIFLCFRTSFSEWIIYQVTIFYSNHTIKRKEFCKKSVRIWSYFGPYFSRIFPNLDWIREKCGPE